jgi:O-antigen ligase
MKLYNIFLISVAIALPALAASRASLLGMGIILAVYFYYYNKRLFYVGTILSLLVIVIVLLSPVLLELMRLANDPLSQRDKVWELGLSAWKEKILFGAGYGTTESFTSNKYLFMAKGLTDFLLGKRFNNIYIEMLYETGIVGLLLFVASIVFLLRETYKIINSSFGEKKVLTVCYFGLLIAVIIQSIFESFILSAGNASSLAFWIFTGLVITGAPENTQNRKFNK